MPATLHRLDLLDQHAEYPVWVNAAFLSLVGMLRVPLLESDLADESLLPYGHLAFVEDDAQLWVCRVWYDGRELGQVVLQFTADLRLITAIHDWQLEAINAPGVRGLLLALMSSAEIGVGVIAADEDMQQLLQHVLGGLPFDLHNCTRLYWGSYAQECLA